MASAIKPGRKKKGDANMTIPKHLLIEINKLTNWKPIGAGGCGQVFSVNHGDWGPLAVKKLGVSVIDEGRAITSKLKREACLLYDLRHPNIIQFTGVLWTPPEFGLAMPLVAHGSLDKFIEEYETGPLVKINFLQQIGVGLNYLHSLPEPVIHGDLKLGNILVDYGCVMKLADFGLSSWREYQTTFSKTSTHGVQGTITHVAPEMWSAPMKPLEPQDVYALGILSWELFAEKTAFEGQSKDMISHFVTHGTRPDLNDMGRGVPQKLKELVESCWAQEVKHRPAVHEIRSSLAEIAAPIEKEITRAKSELVVALNEDSGGEDEEHLRVKRDQERDEEETARKERERLLKIEEREREIEWREMEEQRRREQEGIDREKHKKEEKEKMERLEKRLHEMELREKEEKTKRERDQKEREREKLRRKEIEDQMRKQDEKMKQLIQERKQAEKREQEKLKMASPLGEFGSFSVKDSAVNSTIHLCDVGDGSDEAYDDKVRAIRATAFVWPERYTPPSVLPGVEVLRVGDGWDWSWDAAVGGLQQAESRGHRSVAVAWWGDYSIQPLFDHATSRRAAAAADIWVLLRDTSGLSSWWQQQLSKDARYQRLQ